MWYSFLNYFFFFFHTLFTLFNLLGWLFKRSRRWNLFTLLLTAFSWFVLGIWYGWGYCLCTDWHWAIRQKMGYHDRTDSYIAFLLKNLFGLEPDPRFVDRMVVILFFLALAGSIILNIRDRQKKQP